MSNKRNPKIKKELAEVKKENDFLKKAVGFVSPEEV